MLAIGVDAQNGASDAHRAVRVLRAIVIEPAAGELALGGTAKLRCLLLDLGTYSIDVSDAALWRSIDRTWRRSAARPARAR